ncbi:hypothetical protein PybrP1_003561 [[Pythium] brassicae (nom. inval.)]|nr:hypothetical protein PybrP1_003561 [[Pythium] brassicae (nom. inval.)]
MLANRDVHEPACPGVQDLAAQHQWKQMMWALAKSIDSDVNERRHQLNGKRQTKTSGSLRKRWLALRRTARVEYDIHWARAFERRAVGTLRDGCTPLSHQLSAADME